MSNFPLHGLRLKFSPLPGAHERHLKRIHQNPLFSALRGPVTADLLEAAQMRDSLEADKFHEEFTALVQRTVALEGNVESDVILGLKQELDKSYETCSGLMGEQSEIKAAIRHLLAVIMAAIHRGAGNDAEALHNLEEEETARQMHFELLQIALVADLLRPDSPVVADELVPTLLSEADDALAAAMTLFSSEQQLTLCAEARVLLEALEAQGNAPQTARGRLAVMEKISRMSGIN